MKSIMNWLISVVVVLAVAYLAIVIGMYTYQRKLMYLPDTLHHTPGQAGLVGISEITITTKDGERLQAWHLPATNGQPTILYLHGNGGSIAGRAGRLAYYQRQGVGALFVSYRGYGSSTGAPDEGGLVNDALAAHDWLQQQKIPPENIVLVGESLGAAVAARLALQRHVRGLVMESPFTSTIDIAKDVYWWLPIDLLMKDRFETIKIIQKVDVPILIVHGEKDEITNVAQGRALFEKANQPKKLAIINGASHNDLSVQSTWQLEQDFIKSLSLQ